MSAEQVDRVARSLLRSEALLRLLDSDRRPATVEQVVAGLRIELALQRDNVWLQLDELGLPVPEPPLLASRSAMRPEPDGLF
jgi:hypothetical protein